MKEVKIIQYNRYKEYALWYYFRYYPSKNKLIEKLNQKSDNNKVFLNKAIEEIFHLFNEREVLEHKIDNLIFRNKNKNYIIHNLLQKKFKKNDILDILNNRIIQGESLLDEHFIQNKIISYKNKNKSINYIKNKLIEQESDKNIVEKLINEIYADGGEFLEIKNEYKKLYNKNLEQQKIIQRLLQKGFQYYDIKKLF